MLKRPRCAICHDDISGHIWACPSCSTLLHDDCALEKCPTLGCQGGVSADRARALGEARARRRVTRVATFFAMSTSFALGWLSAVEVAPSRGPAPAISPPTPVIATGSDERHGPSTSSEGVIFYTTDSSVLLDNTTCTLPNGLALPPGK